MSEYTAMQGPLGDVPDLRAEFVRLLTVDSQTTDRRRKEFNQAIFATEEEGGGTVWDSTSLSMVLDKFDRAMKNLGMRSA